jgi:hypothetical protein
MPTPVHDPSALTSLTPSSEGANPLLRCFGSADPITLSYVVATTRSTVTPPDRSAFSGLSGVNRARITPLSPLNAPKGRRSARVACFGEGGADGADHLIGVAIEVVGGDEHDFQSSACNRLIMRRSLRS